MSSVENKLSSRGKGKQTFKFRLCACSFTFKNLFSQSQGKRRYLFLSEQNARLL